MWICPRCGAENWDNAKSCIRCKRFLSEARAEARADQQPTADALPQRRQRGDTGQTSPPFLTKVRIATTWALAAIPAFILFALVFNIVSFICIDIYLRLQFDAMTEAITKTLLSSASSPNFSEPQFDEDLKRMSDNIQEAAEAAVQPAEAIIKDLQAALSSGDRPVNTSQLSETLGLIPAQIAQQLTPDINLIIQDLTERLSPDAIRARKGLPPLQATPPPSKPPTARDLMMQEKAQALEDRFRDSAAALDERFQGNADSR